MFNNKTFKVILTLLSIFATNACEEKSKINNQIKNADMEIQDQTDLDIPVQMMQFETIDIEPDHDMILDMD
jgi:hypothetical protein